MNYFWAFVVGGAICVIGQLLIDLTYEPEVTPFLEEGLAHGCRTANGLTMLRAQAEAAWHHFRDKRISEPSSSSKVS